MYISKIELENIRCFDKLTIDLKKDEDIILWATILGNNAVGKSTILKCIAMGLCDESSAAALMKESGEFLRKNEDKGYIKLTVEQKEGNRKVEIVTKITKDNLESPENLRQEIINEGPLDDLFFCGYGVEIGNIGSTSFKKYLPLEAVYTLFNYNSELQNPELIMRRQSDSGRKLLEEKLLNILMLEGCKIDYNLTGMVFTRPEGEFLIGELSDGYKSVALRIIDFFGWAGYANKLVKIGDEITGILLFDELENHLHPRWQRFVVDKLRTQLPKVQIIITTHSPIIALATADLENALLVELEFDPLIDSVARNRPVDAKDYKGLTVDQILTSSPFNLPIARSGITGDKLVEFRTLFMNEIRTEEEEKKFIELKNEMDKDIPEAGETEMDRILQKELRDELKKINQQIGAIKNDKT